MFPPDKKLLRCGPEQLYLGHGVPALHLAKPLLHSVPINRQEISGQVCPRLLPLHFPFRPVAGRSAKVPRPGGTTFLWLPGARPVADDNETCTQFLKTAHASTGSAKETWCRWTTAPTPWRGRSSSSTGCSCTGTA